MNQTESSLVKHAIMNSFYVDDLASSVQYKSDVKCVVDDLKKVILSRGFNLKKYMANGVFYCEPVINFLDVYSKATMLSIIASMFDPLGFVRPATISGCSKMQTV